MGAPIDPPTERLRVRSDAVTAELDGQITVFDGAQDALVLNGSASAVWLALGDPRTLDEVVALVAEQYGEPVEVVHQPVADLVARLRDRALVLPA